jgi:uncharacterized protein with HEPN domain
MKPRKGATQTHQYNQSEESRCKRLKELVDSNEFLDKDSQEYSAAMYLLIRLLEEKKSLTNDRGQALYPALNQLRNGLVHGFFEVDPNMAKEFVITEIEKLQHNRPLSKNLREYQLFNSISKYQGSLQTIRDTLTKDLSTAMRSDPSLSQDPQFVTQYTQNFITTCYDTLPYHQERINSYNSFYAQNGQDDSRDTTLFQIGCFSETIKQIMECCGTYSNSISPIDTTLIEITEYRNKIFHDTGVDRRSSGLVEISSQQVYDMTKYIAQYNHYTRTAIPDSAQHSYVSSRSHPDPINQDNSKDLMSQVKDSFQALISSSEPDHKFTFCVIPWNVEKSIGDNTALETELKKFLSESVTENKGIETSKIFILLKLNEEQQNTADNINMHYSVLHLKKDVEDKITFSYSDSLATQDRNSELESLSTIIQDSGIDASQKAFTSNLQGDNLNSCYGALFNALKMLNIQPMQNNIDDFISQQLLASQSNAQHQAPSISSQDNQKTTWVGRVGEKRKLESLIEEDHNKTP